MRGDPRLTKPVGQLARDALGHAPCVDEYQRGAVGFDQLGEPVIDLIPDLRRHHGFERGRRHFELQIARTIMSGVDD